MYECARQCAGAVSSRVWPGEGLYEDSCDNDRCANYRAGHLPGRRLQFLRAGQNKRLPKEARDAIARSRDGVLSFTPRTALRTLSLQTAGLRIQ